MFEIELVITANNIDDAKRAMRSIGLSDENIQGLGSIFIVNISFDKELSNHVYEEIEKSETISIVRDSSSQKRGEEVSRNLYLVESHLRRLLLYIPDITDTYLDIIVKKAAYYKGSVKVSEKMSLDAITSQLTLGQIIKVFDYITSKNANDTLTWSKLLDMLDDISNLAALRKKIKNEITPITVWDAISEHVLKNPVELARISGKLFKLKGIRDTAAHYRIITQKNVEEALFLTKNLISELEIKQLTAIDQAAIRAVDKKASDLIRDMDVANGGYPSDLAVAPIASIVDSWGMYNRESVSYVAWKVDQMCQQMPYWGGRGNANQWPANARAAGIATGTTPKAGSVAISMNGYYGHAMWVENVLPGNQIGVSQYNHDLQGSYSEMTTPAEGLIYIYF